MRIWSYGTNSYERTANICATIVPAYLCFIERAVDWFCSFLGKFPLPSIGRVVDGSSTYTYKEWYGTFGGWFHSLVHIPVFGYVYNSNRVQMFFIPVDYDKLKFVLKELDEEYWREIEITEGYFEEELW